ncbi:hypothetical protein [uncultured Paludibaculum sp.]|uniref:hypothetical protein n=1 Tax=uncultured Paludibaculum sp. TaxID=1765020 RepID=UPI002AAB3FDA|nr:hypothetical protein [uncultured Paludibaculum sp.]
MRFISRLLQLSVVFLIAVALAFGQGGRWDGTLQAGGQELQIGLDLVKDEKGIWAGTFSQNPPGIRDVPVVDLKVEETAVTFHMVSSSGPEFVCKLGSADAMTCTLTAPGRTINFDLKRTGEGKVVAQKASPAVSKELEGDWEGNLETPGGTLKIVMHFKNQADGTVKATLDSPVQGANGMSMTDIAQMGPAVECKVPVVNGSYKGTFNKESTEISGEWSQGGAALALVMRKPAAAPGPGK